MDNKDNATWLFIEPAQHYHHSESFWSSLFALHVLMASRSNRSLAIPAYQYREDRGSWKFEPDGFFHVPNGLDFREIVVEGKIRPGFLSRVQSDLPPDLLDLRPDILLHHSDRVAIVEVKTVGHELGHYQKQCYDKLAKYIQDRGYQAELYFLISAGHEVARNFKLLRTESLNTPSFKLLLWEAVLQQMCEEPPISPLAMSLGDISEYYRHKEHYMQGLA